MQLTAPRRPVRSIRLCYRVRIRAPAPQPIPSVRRSPTEIGGAPLQRRNGRPLRLTAVAAVLAIAAVACTDSTISSPTPHSFRCEISPPSGTPAVRGTTMSVAMKVLDIPEDTRSVFLFIGVQFERPDGVVDNSYLPGVPPAKLPMPWTGELPVTIECQFQVPVGTPEGNSFIPAGSRVLELWAIPTMDDRSLHTSTGVRAVYPVVG
jgi:hypothetical protein